MGHNIIPIGLSLLEVLEVYSDTTEWRTSWSHLIVIPDDGSNRLDGIALDLRANNNKWRSIMDVDLP